MQSNRLSCDMNIYESIYNNYMYDIDRDERGESFKVNKFSITISDLHKKEDVTPHMHAFSQHIQHFCEI
jgi:hypothetical protein